jgi:hypothetical protein
MERKIVLAGVLVLVLAAALLVLAPRDGQAGWKKNAPAVKTGRQVLAGEIIDLDCYYPDPKGGRGPAHAECAKSCLSSGKPAGLLVGERMYLVMGAGDAVSHEELGAVAGYPVRVTGTVMVENELPAIFIEKVERTDAPAKADAPAKTDAHAAPK